MPMPCIICKAENWTKKKHLKQLATNAAKNRMLLGLAAPSLHPITFPVNIKERQPSCSECNSDMARRPCCRQFQPTLKLDDSMYDCPTVLARYTQLHALAIISIVYHSKVRVGNVKFVIVLKLQCLIV